MSVLHKKWLHARALRPQEKEAVQLEEHRGMLSQWTATKVRLEATDIVMGAVYLAPNLGIQGSNWSTLMELTDYLHVQGLPYIIAGGYKCEIWELEAMGIGSYIGGEFQAPRGQVTGGHRAIDFVLVSSQLKGALDIQWDPNSPWASPHTGFHVTVRKKALSMQVRVFKNPVDYKPAMGPDRPWEWYVQETQSAAEEGLQRARAARHDHLAYSEAVDDIYSTFCVAAEEVWAHQQGTSGDAQEMRRGWPVETKMVKLAPTKPEGWSREDIGLTGWQALNTRVVNYNGVYRRGRREHAVAA